MYPGEIWSNYRRVFGSWLDNRVQWWNALDAAEANWRQDSGFGRLLFASIVGQAKSGGAPHARKHPESSESCIGAAESAAGKSLWGIQSWPWQRSVDQEALADWLDRCRQILGMFLSAESIQPLGPIQTQFLPCRWTIKPTVNKPCFNSPSPANQWMNHSTPLRSQSPYCKSPRILRYSLAYKTSRSEEVSKYALIVLFVSVPLEFPNPTTNPVIHTWEKHIYICIYIYVCVCNICMCIYIYMCVYVYICMYACNVM